MKIGHQNELNLETRTDQLTTQTARDEREGGASSGNDDDEADAAAAATAVLEGTLSLHNTFMDVVIRYLYVHHKYLYRTTSPELELLHVKSLESYAKFRQLAVSASYGASCCCRDATRQKNLEGKAESSNPS